MTKEEQFGFLSNDGKTTIHAVKWIPEGGEYKAVLQIVHGMVEYIERYRPFAEYMNEKGVLVVGHDHLGHGGSVTSEEEWGFIADTEHPSDVMVSDMHRVRVIVQGENPNIPYFMLGHSMGSYMLRKYLCRHNKKLAGAIIMGTGSEPDNAAKLGLALCKIMAFFRGWHYRSKLIQSLTYGKPYKRYDLYGKDYGNSWLTKDTDIVRAYYKEPRCTFLFTLNGYRALLEAVYYDNQMGNIRRVPKELPLLFVSGEDDPVGNLGVGVKKVYSMYKAAGLKDITYKLYEGDRHEILNELDRKRVYADISAWLSVRVES